MIISLKFPKEGIPNRGSVRVCSHFKEEVTHFCGKPTEVQESDTSRAKTI